MKKSLLMCLAVTLAGVLILAQYASAAPASRTITWTFPLTTAGKAIPSMVTEMGKVLLERTNGKFTWKVGRFEELGYKGPEMLQIYESGQQKIGQLGGPYVASEEPVLALLSLPLTSTLENIPAKIKAFRPFVEERLDKHNIKLLSMIDNPNQIWSKIELNTMDDVKKLKIRAHPEFIRVMVNLGGTGVTMPLAEIYQALATGIINSAGFSAVGGWPIGFGDVTKFLYLSPLVGSATHFMVVNKTAFNSLPKDVQKVLIDTANEYEPKMIRAALILPAPMRAEMEKKIKIYDSLNPQLVEQMTKIGAVPVWKKWIEKYPQTKPAVDSLLKASGITW